MGVGSDIYSGSASLGRVTTIIRAVVGTVVSIMLIIVGVVLIRAKGKLTDSTNSGIVTNSPSCTPQVNDNMTEYQCNGVNLSYNVSGKAYTITFNATTSTNYSTKPTGITVYYDPSNPENGSINSDTNHVAGWVALVMGVIILIGVWIAVILASKYKFFAASEGVATGAGLVSGAIHNF